MLNKHQIIGDPKFTEGFRLLDIISVPNVGTRGYLYTGNQEPLWRLCEWSTRWPLNPEQGHSGKGWHSCGNQAKTVCIADDVLAGGDLLLQVSTFSEYGGKPRSADTPWVHLLVDQHLSEPTSLKDCESVRLVGRLRMLHYRAPMAEVIDPHLHAAQFFIYFTVRNCNQQSPGYSDYYWFGIPFFDSRSAVIADYQAEDFGGTSKFIYTPGTVSYGLGDLRTLDWLSFDLELHPWLHAGLEAAWAAGYLPTSHHSEDFAITAVNMGWEVPGTFDVAMQVEGLACWVIRT